MQNMRKTIDDALKVAMKGRNDKLRVSTLRLVNAAIKDRDIAARAEDRCEGVSDDEIIAILTKMAKQREDASAAFEQGGRPELAEQERAEIEVIREFMPQQMDDDAIRSVVDEVLTEFEATGLKDMGKCMGALKERYHGAMDFGKAGKLLKESLSGQAK